MGQRIAGIAFLLVDGTQYALRGSFTVSPSSLERTGIAGQDYVHGYSELPRVPFIEGDISIVPGVFSTDTLEAITNSTIQANLANGYNYVLSQAWCKSAIEINTHDGMARVRFEGVTCQEVT